MKLTNKLTALLILGTMTFSTFTKAEDVVIPVISKPAVLQEGTQRDLTAAQIAELLPWAKDSKVFLVDLLNSTEGLTSSDRVDRLIDGMKAVVGESAPKNSELLMRYSINRGLVVADILSKEAASDEVGSVDAKIRILVQSIKMAIKYYDTDMATLSKKSPAPFITFGLDYFAFLTELNKSIFDASAQYSIQRTSLEWLQWDLYRDLNNTAYAAQIVKINNSMKIFPAKASSDKVAINYTRQMKSLTQQLNLRDVGPTGKRTITGTSQFSQASKNNKIYNISRPKIGNFAINSESNINDVCRAIGYKEGVAGSMTYASTSSYLATISGNNFSAYGPGYYIESITCLNQASSIDFPKATYIQTPKLSGSTALSYDSDPNQACQILGYESGLKYENDYASTSSHLVSIDSKGKLSALPSGYYLKGLVCLNKISNSESLTLIDVNIPKIDGNVIRYDSNQNAVCRLLGFDAAASGEIAYSSTSSLVLNIEASGAIKSADTSGYYMNNVMCIRQ